MLRLFYFFIHKYKRLCFCWGCTQCLTYNLHSAIEMICSPLYCDCGDPLLIIHYLSNICSSCTIVLGVLKGFWEYYLKTLSHCRPRQYLTHTPTWFLQTHITHFITYSGAVSYTPPALCVRTQCAHLTKHNGWFHPLSYWSYGLDFVVQCAIERSVWETSHISSLYLRVISDGYTLRF